MVSPRLLVDEVPPDEGLADRASDHELMHLSIEAERAESQDLLNLKVFKKCDQAHLFSELTYSETTFK